MVIGATILAVTAFTEINGEDQNGNHEGGWDSLWAKYECAYAQDFKNSSETITGRVMFTSTVRGSLRTCGLVWTGEFLVTSKRRSMWWNSRRL